ncbi:alpha/beta hydrolase fold domain-containing protein [[Mycobacterium] crassicus]|uniref:Alpha/beta hydrolase n=1 Tax=[Mycobacterium] crassicus TaxID=2872309 RepID=A0ABU5XIP8_9MYCO|nr:alpha/beta hydrolase [Mycolicibacter sp. MYC098]MEB3022160.1 alpha/beta hydrolase [Mycolicibacter sp. MYC098]
MLSPLLREVVEDGPSLAGRLVGLAARATIRPTLAIGSHLPNAPWPWGVVNFVARGATPAPGSMHGTVRLPRCAARLVRGPGVLPAAGAERVVLYLHGGAFITGGPDTHGRMVAALSHYADSPVLMVDYRLVPAHSVKDAIDDCYDGYRWLRDQGYEPGQIVLAGDSAGGYLCLALAQRLLDEGERPAAMVAMSPLTQIAKAAKQAHPNIHTDAMFGAKAFDALVDLITKAARRNGQSEAIYEPLEHIKPGLPRTLIHVSDSEVLLHDARLAACRLAAVGVPVQLRVWPGQVHGFQLAGAIVPEAVRSLRQIGEYIREATSQLSLAPVAEDYGR